MNKQEIEIAIGIIASDKKAFESVNHGGFTNKIKAFELAISALEQQLTNGWIPVSERLPENESMYLITSKLNNTNEIQYCFFSTNLNGFICNGKAIAWQPLPPKYKEELE